MATKTKTTKIPGVKAPAITKADIKKGVWNGEKIPTWTAARLVTEATAIADSGSTFFLALCAFYQKAGQRGCNALKKTVYKSAELKDGGKQGKAYKVLTGQTSRAFKVLGFTHDAKPRGVNAGGAVIDKGKIVAAIKTLITGAESAGFDKVQMTYFTKTCAIIQQHFEPVKAGKRNGIKRVKEGNVETITYE